jgi:hypothetical protein
MLRVIGHQTVIRIHELGTYDIATRELRVADWMRSHRIPVPEPSPLAPDPIIVGHRPVTLWEDLGSGGPAGPAETARMLRHLHSLKVPSHLGLSRFQLPSFEARIAQAQTDDRSRAWLTGFAAELYRRWQVVDWPTEWRVIHGDPSSGNTLRAPHGGHLVDLESCCMGPAEWDQTVIAVQSDTLLEPPSHWDAFRQAYGADVTAWAGYQVIRDVRSLQLCLFALRHAHVSDHARKQADYRLECLRGLWGDRPWNWVAP